MTTVFIPPEGFEHLIRFVFPGSPVPYTRMTQGSRWTKAAQNYLGYRNALADALRFSFPGLVLPPAPDARLFPKERKAYNKQHAGAVYALGVTAFIAADRGDWSNFYKTVEDALQCAGLIWNDRLIRCSLGGWVVIDKENPRIVFELWRMV